MTGRDKGGRDDDDRADRRHPMRESFSPTAGDGDPGQGDLFRCPKCDRVWRRGFVGEAVPTCPADHVKYVKVP